MFASCADPSALSGLSWLLCYLTTGKHLLFYGSFGTVLMVLFVTAPVSLPSSQIAAPAGTEVTVRLPVGSPGGTGSATEM